MEKQSQTNSEKGNECKKSIIQSVYVYVGVCVLGER